MSEIPFVNRLGDAIETAINATPARSPHVRRRRRRGQLLLAVAALLTVGGGAALAGIFSNPTALATNSVGCYETSDLDGGTIVVWTGDRSPVQTCARELRRAGRPVPALTACDSGHGSVAVFPASGAGACKRAGLKALPARYGAERARVSTLERRVIALESSADCIPPRELATRVQSLLRRSGWTGWRPWLRLDISSGPCGSVSSPGGNGVRTIAGMLDEQGRRVMVTGGPYRSTQDLTGTDIGWPLIRDSGARCFSPAGIRALARDRLAQSGRSVQFTVSRPEPNVGLSDRRSERLAAGCAVIVDVTPARDGLGIVVKMWQRG